MLSIQRKMLERFALNSFVSGDFERAEKYFLRLKEDDPDRMGVDHNMGLVKLGLKQFAEAEKFFLRDAELFGESYVRSRTLGDLYYIWGRREQRGVHLVPREDLLPRLLLRLLSHADPRIGVDEARAANGLHGIFGPGDPARIGRKRFSRRWASI